MLEVGNKTNGLSARRWPAQSVDAQVSIPYMEPEKQMRFRQQHASRTSSTGFELCISTCELDFLAVGVRSKLCVL